MENHILWFFLWLLISQYFTAFDTILHLGALISPFLSVIGYSNLMISCLSFSSYHKCVNSLNRLDGRLAFDAPGAR
jgi:hypothetical protein